MRGSFYVIIVKQEFGYLEQIAISSRMSSPSFPTLTRFPGRRPSIPMVVADVAFSIAVASGTDRPRLVAAAACIAGTPSVAAVPA